MTAGNASGINDGAAAVLLMSAAAAAKRNITPLAAVVAGASCGVDPAMMGIGPAPASRKCLQKAGWSAADLDLMEINEAFAAQAIAVNREMQWDDSKVNVNGGAIALGHPIGASGARVLTTLLHEMPRRNAKKPSPPYASAAAWGLHWRWRGKRCLALTSASLKLRMLFAATLIWWQNILARTRRLILSPANFRCRKESTVLTCCFRAARKFFLWN